MQGCRSGGGGDLRGRKFPSALTEVAEDVQTVVGRHLRDAVPRNPALKRHKYPDRVEGVQRGKA